MQTRWSIQNQHKYERRGEIADLLVAEMSLLFISQVFRSHVLKWRTDNTIVFKHSIASYKLLRPFPSVLRVNLKKFSSSGCLNRNTISIRNQIKSLCNPYRFHSHSIELWFKKCINIVKSTVFQLDVTTRENIDMCDGVFEEHFCYSVFLSKLKTVDSNYFIFYFFFSHLLFPVYFILIFGDLGLRLTWHHSHTVTYHTEEHRRFWKDDVI